MVGQQDIASERGKYILKDASIIIFVFQAVQRTTEIKALGKLSRCYIWDVVLIFVPPKQATRPGSLPDLEIL